MASKNDPKAVETATRKRSLEPSSALAEVSPKRPCNGSDTDGDSFEEFFALLQRIEATDRLCLRRRGGNRQEPAAKCIEAGKVNDAKAVTSQVSWLPSFEWEDFLPRRIGTRGVDSKAGDQNFKGRERERERVSSPANLDGERGLDLNLPSELISL